MANLQVDDDAMKALIAKSIVDSLTPEARESLITNAVGNLLTKGADGYSKRAPIQQAFDYAVDSVARKFAEETLTNDQEFQTKLKSLFAAVADKLFAEDTREELVDSIAKTIRQALTKDRY